MIRNKRTTRQSHKSLWLKDLLLKMSGEGEHPVEAFQKSVV